MHQTAYLYITKKNCAGHGEVFHTDEANEEMARLHQESKTKADFTEEELEAYLDEFHAQVNKALMSIPNEEFLKRVDQLFKKSIV